MHWYFDAWQRYAQFSGRASREAFWMFFLVNSLISMAFVLAETFYQSTWKIEAIYSLAIFLPLLSLTVRRLHDTQRSAWWLSVILIPVIGMVMLLILLTLPSEPPHTDMDSPQHGNTL